jgi:membrane protease YdiL (CAAX protease family)
MAPGGFMIQVFAFQFFLLGLGLVLARWAGLDPVSACRWGPGAIAMGIAGGAGMGLVALRVTAHPVFRDLERLINRQVAPLFADLSWQDLLAIAAMAGASEEVLFRGMLQPWLAGVLPGGEWTAIAAAATLFGLCHALSPAYFLFAFALGAVFGWSAMATENLAVPIILHAAYDAVVLLDMTGKKTEDGN